MKQVTIGQYIAIRLSEMGLSHYFAIPGDYNLGLLDQLLTNKKLDAIYCCNELNAAYAADGYARANGLAALFTTYTVGSLSALNGIAGAYSEDLPVIMVSGGPNSNSPAEDQILHHTLGNTDYNYSCEIFKQVTASTAIIRHPHHAASQIDEALQIAIQTKKPVYIEVACNIAGSLISAPQPLTFHDKKETDPASLKAAVKHAAEMLNNAVKPVLVAGSKMLSFGGIDGFNKLAKASAYGVASMPDAKGLLDESSKQYIGIYWGSVSTPGCGEIVESCDAYLFAGPRFTDYSTVGYTALITPDKLICVSENTVSLQGETYNRVNMDDFLNELSKHIKANSASLDAYDRIRGEAPIPPAGNKAKPLSRRRLFACIQDMLDKDSAVLAETGDSWFNGLDLKLPKGCEFVIQMQYGSIGWSVGASLGYAANLARKKQVISLIGDGSFQMSAQEVSTMIRYNIPVIIFLMNNSGYVIEVEIHDGPYNVIKNWDYAGLAQVFNAEDGKALSFKVGTENELQKAIDAAQQHKGVSFIEVELDHQDCNKKLFKWGSTVAENNGRPPRDL